MGTGMMKTLVVPQSVAPKRRTSSQWCLRLRRLCWCVIPFPAPPPGILHHHGIRLWPCLGWVEDYQYIWILPSFLVVIFIRFSSSFSFSSMHGVYALRRIVLMHQIGCVHVFYHGSLIHSLTIFCSDGCNYVTQKVLLACLFK
uniref:Uncharacterized protein n=1 Tax=Triticum urartu TaxID=4572 RepID=A0A8R7PYU9_TRIUA